MPTSSREDFVNGLLALRRVGGVLFLALMLWTAMSANVKAQDPVKICDDISPWPPYSYLTAREKLGTNKMVEFLDDLFKEIGLEYTLSSP